MKASFNDFLAENPNCSKYSNNRSAIQVFDILSEDDNIISMIDACEAGKPALSACVSVIENWFDTHPDPSFDFNDNFVRTVVGRMVKTILSPFGYEVTTQKDLPKASRGKYFSSASCYKKTGIATMKVVRTIVEV